MLPAALQIGKRVTVAPVIHGSGDCALEVRRLMLEHRFQCVAAPLPPSFQDEVERAIQRLPAPAMIVQPPRPESPWKSSWSPTQKPWSPDENDEDDDDDDDVQGDGDPSGESASKPWSYVPIDPCQAVIHALRIAMGEHIERRFIDMETDVFEAHSAPLPDAYALKRVSLERFATAILPSIRRPLSRQWDQRIRHMASRLRELEKHFESILFVCSVLEWPWVREAYVEQLEPQDASESVFPVHARYPDEKSLIFMFGELPFTTGLYERARAELDDDANLSIDGVKTLLLTARDAYRGELKTRARPITPQVLSCCLKFIRNLSLIDRRLTPDLCSIVLAAKKTAGATFARHVAETAYKYPYATTHCWYDVLLEQAKRYENASFPFLSPPPHENPIKLGVGRGIVAQGQVVDLVSRLPGPPVTWFKIDLTKRPQPDDQRKWRMQWNPMQQCSYPPEDARIEELRSRVMEAARKILGADLARTEKFSTSIKDGIDIRDTLRHWYDGDIYVKIMPPNIGALDCCVMLFDSPADPRLYTWRSTWYAEHEDESTLAFYATDFRKEIIGPGICAGTYGGALFLYPPRPIPDIWRDPRFDFAETLEERLLAAAAVYSRSRRIALLSALPPGSLWRQLARRCKKQWVHVPLSQFSEQTIQQLRIVHVLNGKEVRSYAARFIRKA